jgi:hypothetical protein
MTELDQPTPQREDPTDDKKMARDHLLKRYETEIDLYKFYLDIAIKGSLFAFGLTGALLSYYFTNYEKNPMLVWALPLPILLNAGLCVLFRASIHASTHMMIDHEETCKQLHHLKAFDTNPLPAVCKIFSAMYGLVAAGLTILFLFHSITYLRHAI